MIRLFEILAIVGFSSLAFIGIQIVRGGKKSAIVISILVSLALLFFNAKLEDETGKGIVQTAYCLAVECVSDRPSISEDFLDSDDVELLPEAPAVDSSAQKRPIDQGSRQTQSILLVRGEDPAGTPIYAFVSVPSDQVDRFLAAQNQGLFYPEKYGTVIISGEGEPSADVRKFMEETYNFDFEDMKNL